MLCVLQVISAQSTIVQFFVVAIAIVFIVLEATHHTSETHERALLLAASAIALVCLTATLVLGGMLTRGIIDNIKAATRW